MHVREHQVEVRRPTVHHVRVRAQLHGRAWIVPVARGARFLFGLGDNVMENTMLAGISGSSTADASTVAKLLIPEMAKRGYDRPFSAALTAAAATLANLIPPSLGLIVYAALASVSVGALFVATAFTAPRYVGTR